MKEEMADAITGGKIIGYLMNEIYANAREKGFWDAETANIPTKIALVMSELCEALEAHRRDRFVNKDEFNALQSINDTGEYEVAFKNTAKDTFEDELADTFIRLLDLAEGMGVDLYSHVRAKMKFNSLRIHKHGVKY